MSCSWGLALGNDGLPATNRDLKDSSKINARRNLAAVYLHPTEPRCSIPAGLAVSGHGLDPARTSGEEQLDSWG
jgi:hypothetical protein